MIFTNSKITNRLMIATAIALGSAISYADASLGQNSATYGTDPIDFSDAGTWGKVTGTIKSATLEIINKTNVDIQNGCKDPRTLSPDPINLLTPAAGKRYPISSNNCTGAQATAIATNNVSLNKDTGEFSGSLSISGSVSRQSSQKAKLHASSSAKVTVTTTSLSGSFKNPTPLYDYRTIELPSARIRTVTSVRYSTANNGGQVLSRGTLFEAVSVLNGNVTWSNSLISFSGVTDGTFSIRFGKKATRQGELGELGELLFRFENGTITESRDSGYLDGLLQGIDDDGTFTIANPGFGFDYTLSHRGNPSTATIIYSTEVAIVPEPITIVGTLTALGFGTYFKKKYNKRSRN